MANSSRSEREAARRARVEQLQREQRAQERRRTLLVLSILGVVIVLIVIAVAFSLIRSSTSDTAGNQIIPSTPSGPVTTQPTPARVPNTTGIPGVLAWDTKGYPAAGTADAGTIGHDHVTGPVTYAVVPPVGGPHNPVWMNAGVYTEPIPSERAVHTLEHGAVWITYDPNLPAKQVAALTAFVGRQSLIDEAAGTAIPGQSNRFVDMSPWATNTLPSPIVISSWGYQLRVQSPSDPRLQKFVDTFRRSTKYTPEDSSPVDGQPIQTSGRAAEFGGTKPNPAGAAAGQ